MRWLVASVVVVIACGPGLRRSGEDKYSYRSATFEDDAATLLHATEARDAGAIRKLLRDSVTIGGLSFEDIECVKQFSMPREVKGPKLDELARCLAGLGMTRSTRADALPDVLVLTYDPGIELEARILSFEDGPWLAWIGYVARQNIHDAIPTVTQATLEQARLEGNVDPFVGGPSTVKADDLDYAWIKVCLDATGAVTGTHLREASSTVAARAFMDGIKTWKFKPFMLRGQPSPVCSMMSIVHPIPDKPVTLALPLPVPESAEARVMVPSQTLTRIAGDKMIAPDDMDKYRIEHMRVRRFIGAFEFCVNDIGDVDAVLVLRPTGLPKYDQKIIHAIKDWKYSPYLDEGKPIAVCSSALFVYTQR